MATQRSILHSSNQSLLRNPNLGSVEIKIIQVVIEFKRIGEIGKQFYIFKLYLY
jgi:hypothetical protein